MRRHILTRRAQTGNSGEVDHLFSVQTPILDRLAHDTQRIELWGESLRKKWNKKQLELNTEN